MKRCGITKCTNVATHGIFWGAWGTYDTLCRKHSKDEEVVGDFKILTLKKAKILAKMEREVKSLWKGRYKRDVA